MYGYGLGIDIKGVTIIAALSKLVSDYSTRVIALGGNVESLNCIRDNFTLEEIENSKLIVTPYGYSVGVLYALKPTDGSGDATIVRNTTKTRVNEQGVIEEKPANVLAPDYLNESCPVINVEGQSTNRVEYSNIFSNAVWKKNEVTVTANAGISPDGTNNAYKLTPSTSNLSHFLNQPGVSGGAGTFTQSFFVKADGYNFVQLAKAGAEYVNFDLQNKISKGFGETGTIKEIGNGWFRITHTYTTGGNDRTRLAIVQSIDDTKFQAFTGDGTSGVLISKAHLESGTEITSYIDNPNTTLTTRSADTVTIPIPAGTTEIIDKYEDGTTNTITTIPASPYTVPIGKRYEYILMR